MTSLLTEMPPFLQPFFIGYCLLFLCTLYSPCALIGTEQSGMTISLVLDTVFGLSLPGLVFAILAAAPWDHTKLVASQNSCDLLGGLLPSSHYTGVTGP